MKPLFLPAAMGALALLAACSSSENGPGGNASDTASEAAMAKDNAGFTSEVHN